MNYSKSKSTFLASVILHEFDEAGQILRIGIAAIGEPVLGLKRSIRQASKND